MRPIKINYLESICLTFCPRTSRTASDIIYLNQKNKVNSFEQHQKCAQRAIKEQFNEVRSQLELLFLRANEIQISQDEVDAKKVAKDLNFLKNKVEKELECKVDTLSKKDLDRKTLDDQFLTLETSVNLSEKKLDAKVSGLQAKLQLLQDQCTDEDVRMHERLDLEHNRIHDTLIESLRISEERVLAIIEDNKKQMESDVKNHTDELRSVVEDAVSAIKNRCEATEAIVNEQREEFVNFKKDIKESLNNVETNLDKKITQSISQQQNNSANSMRSNFSGSSAIEARLYTLEEFKESIERKLFPNGENDENRNGATINNNSENYNTYCNSQKSLTAIQNFTNRANSPRANILSPRALSPGAANAQGPAVFGMNLRSSGDKEREMVLQKEAKKIRKRDLRKEEKSKRNSTLSPNANILEENANTRTSEASNKSNNFNNFEKNSNKNDDSITAEMFLNSSLDYPHPSPGSTTRLTADGFFSHN